MKRFTIKLKELIRSYKFKLVIGFALGGVLLIAGTALIVLSSVIRFEEWRDLDPSLILEAPEALKIKDKDGNEIAFLGTEKRIPIKTEELQKHTLDAFVAAEDLRFYRHNGLDLYRIFGAAWADVKAGGYVQGASTISQQLIKLSHLSSEKTLDRKLEEAVLAMELERVFDKGEIMEMYLNYIYFGGGYYGIESASLGYFGIHAGELTTAQSALLAGILKSPSAYAPHIDMEASVARRNNILKLMWDHGFIDETEYTAACSEDCLLKDGLPDERNALVDYALNEAKEITGFSVDELMQSGYTLELYLDSEISEYCREIMNDDSFFPSQSAQSAIAVIDENGGIAAISGGRGEYSSAGLNRASSIERQPGSLIKPILVYAPALELKGYSAATVINDEPMNFGDYSPRNSDDKYYGKVTLRTAVTKSLNIPAVEVLEDVGIQKAVEFAKELGVSFDKESIGLPLALGGFTHGVSPLEMAAAYSAFSRGGLYIEPRSVKRIIDRSGNVVYERLYSAKRIMSEENAFILTSMLKSAADEGTGRRLKDYGLSLAAKTGTSIDQNGVRDAWCAAYSKELTAVAWMGTDSAASGSLPSSAVGGNNTAIILGTLFSKIYKNRSFADFTQPDSVVRISVDVSDAGSGTIYAAGENVPEEDVVTEYYKAGTEPKSENPYWKRPPVPDETGWYIDGGVPVISFTADSAAYTYLIYRKDSEGTEKVVFETSGKEGFVSFRDTDVIPGGSYVYRIAAVHPVLKEDDGSPMTSGSSRKMRVVVPFYY